MGSQALNPSATVKVSVMQTCPPGKITVAISEYFHIPVGQAHLMQPVCVPPSLLLNGRCMGSDCF